MVSKFQIELSIPLFIVLLIFILVITLDFIRNLLKEIFSYVNYSKTGSMWSILAVQFIKVVVISYLVYTYYSIYIK